MGCSGVDGGRQGGGEAGWIDEAPAGTDLVADTDGAEP